MAELEAIIGNLEKEIIRLKKLNAKFEAELKNLGVDTEALRKAIMVELTATSEDEDVRGGGGLKKARLTKRSGSHEDAEQVVWDQQQP